MSLNIEISNVFTYAEDIVNALMPVAYGLNALTGIDSFWT